MYSYARPLPCTQHYFISTDSLKCQHLPALVYTLDVLEKRKISARAGNQTMHFQLSSL